VSRDRLERIDAVADEGGGVGGSEETHPAEGPANFRSRSSWAASLPGLAVTITSLGIDGP